MFQFEHIQFDLLKNSTAEVFNRIQIDNPDLTRYCTSISMDQMKTSQVLQEKGKIYLIFYFCERCPDLYQVELNTLLNY